MPTAWVAAPADAVLQRVAAALDDPQRSGVVLVGADGVGKTLLARSAAEGFAAGKPSTAVRWVAGTATGRTVPFGAFHGPARYRGRRRDGQARGAAARRTRLADRSGAAELLFVVDDAHDLDHLSATLVYQLALSRSARLIVTVRADTELPDAVAALSADELLTLVEVEPLDQAATAALLESALGAPLDGPASDEVFRRSQGNPLYLRHLVQAGELENGPPLPALIDGYLAGLATPVRAVLDYLAVAEPAEPRRPGGAGRRACRRRSGSRRGRRFRRRCDGARGPSALHRPRPRRAGTGHRAGVANIAGRTVAGSAIRPHRRPAATRRAGRRERRSCRSRRHGDRGPTGAPAR